MVARAFAIIAIAFVSLVVASPCAAQQPEQQRGPSTPQERGQAVNLTRFLEDDPLNEKAPEARRWLFKWLADVPDITITVCPEFLKPIMGKDKNYSSEILGQLIYGSAAFIIENPDSASDEAAVYLAGLESSLKVYESILKTKPKATWAFLDGLVEKRNKQELDDYVRDILSKGKCKK
ncbi:MAG TPA: hypothetical protein VJS44_20605 [Pyrinomonadaceae bacterium]|nr:hypothetical protein [Pyrinomonadaceae bacterium]